MILTIYKILSGMLMFIASPCCWAPNIFFYFDQMHSCTAESVWQFHCMTVWILAWSEKGPPYACGTTCGDHDDLLSKGCPIPFVCTLLGLRIKCLPMLWSGKWRPMFKPRSLTVALLIPAVSAHTRKATLLDELFSHSCPETYPSFNTSVHAPSTHT